MKRITTLRALDRDYRVDIAISYQVSRHIFTMKELNKEVNRLANRAFDSLLQSGFDARHIRVK